MSEHKVQRFQDKVQKACHMAAELKGTSAEAIQNYLLPLVFDVVTDYEAALQQRAELLEALNNISGIACMNFQEDSDIQDIYEISSAAINRAEATK